MISLKTSTASSPVALEDAILTVTLKNKSDQSVIIPDFHDSTFNAAYFFELELQEIQHSSSLSPKSIEILRPVVPVKAAHEAPQRVKITSGNEYAYVLHLKNWSMIAKTPPIYRKLSPGKYQARFLWRPTTNKKWFQDLGLNWLEASDLNVESPVLLVIK